MITILRILVLIKLITAIEPRPAPACDVGLYTILPLPILYGMYCNTGWSGGSTVLRDNVGDEGGEWGVQPKEVFASDSIDSCTKASN